MKPLPLILILLVAALAAGLSYEFQQTSHLHQVIAQMEKDASAAREQAESDAADLRKMKDQVKTYKLSISQLETINKDLNSGKVAGAKEGDASAASGGANEGAGGMMKNLAKMFNDPKMKGMMRAQQAAGVNMMYADLAKELGLSPEKAKQVLAILGDRQADMAAKGMKAFGDGTADAKAIAESGKETEATRASYDAQLKNVLGADSFTKFQDYEKSIGERFAVDQIQRQLSAGGTPLEPAQSQGLLEIMKQEHARTPPSAFDPANRNSAAQVEAMQSDEALNGWIQTQQDQNRRVLDRARTVLSPDQVLALESAQKQQLEMQQMGVKMSREFLKGGGK